jgi:hypothetical protein
MLPPAGPAQVFRFLSSNPLCYKHGVNIPAYKNACFIPSDTPENRQKKTQLPPPEKRQKKLRYPLKNVRKLSESVKNT